MKYFVSYSYTQEDGKYGFGNVDVEVSRPNRVIEDIRQMETNIQEKFGFDSVVILNWQVLDPSKLTDKQKACKHFWVQVDDCKHSHCNKCDRCASIDKCERERKRCPSC